MEFLGYNGLAAYIGFMMANVSLEFIFCSGWLGDSELGYFV